MHWISKQVIITVFIIKLSLGLQIKTQLMRISSVGDEMVCYKEAGRRESLAVKVDASNTCTGLDWDWGSAPIYETGSTYYEKKHYVEVYEPPTNHFHGEGIRSELRSDIPLQETIGRPVSEFSNRDASSTPKRQRTELLDRLTQDPEENVQLPIVFAPGAYIDMYVEFTTNDFSYAAFQMLDTLDESYDVYSGDDFAIMVHLFLRPTEDYVRVKTFYGGWVDHDKVSYPFIVGQKHKITFEALDNDLQVLVDDKEIDRYNNIVPSQNARLLTYPHFATLLHKVEFVGV